MRRKVKLDIRIYIVIYYYICALDYIVPGWYEIVVNNEDKQVALWLQLMCYINSNNQLTIVTAGSCS